MHHTKQNTLPFLYVQSWKLLKNPFQEPQLLPGFVSDLIVLYFCAARQSQRTPLVKNLNQIGESQQSSSPPLFGSAPLPPGQGNHQSRGATTKLFPEPISCWTVCYTLSNIPKIRLVSKPALIWTPPPCLSPCREPHLQDWRFTLKGWDASEQSRALPERERGPRTKKKKRKKESLWEASLILSGPLPLIGQLSSFSWWEKPPAWAPPSTEKRGNSSAYSIPASPFLVIVVVT